MKKKSIKPKAINTREMLRRVIAVLDLIKSLNYPSMDKLVDELDRRELSHDRRTVFRDLQCLRDSLNWPIFYDAEKRGYYVDMEKGKEAGFDPHVLDPKTLAAMLPQETIRPRASTLPAGESLAEIQKWAKSKLKAWEPLTAQPPTLRMGIFYRGCQILEGLLAQCVSILTVSRVETDDLEAYGRFEEQVALLRQANEEISTTIKARLPGSLKGMLLLSAPDLALLEKLEHFRQQLSNPARSSFKQQLEDVPKLLEQFLPALKDFIDSDFMKTCAVIEPQKQALRGD
ncbi:MAG: hypothetical protein WCO56_07325 [Verrucomicrobiota bacterium]